MAQRGGESGGPCGPEPCPIEEPLPVLPDQGFFFAPDANAGGVEITYAPWEPPLALGSPGWKQSSEPLCSRVQWALTSVSVWSDAGGVFVLITAGRPDPPDCVDTPCDVVAKVIYENDGTGWRSVFDESGGSGSELRRL